MATAFRPAYIDIARVAEKSSHRTWAVGPDANDTSGVRWISCLRLFRVLELGRVLTVYSTN